jgi:hypothetical protein
VSSLFKKTPASSEVPDAGGASSSSRKSGGGGGGGEEMSIEETNKMRASLGLKPLKM